MERLTAQLTFDPHLIIRKFHWVDPLRDLKSKLLVLIVPYAAWLLLMDRMGPIVIPLLLIIVSIVIPYVCRWRIKDRPVAILSALTATPIILASIVYIASQGSDEARAWVGLTTVMVTVFSSPIWILYSLLFRVGDDASKQN